MNDHRQSRGIMRCAILLIGLIATAAAVVGCGGATSTPASFPSQTAPPVPVQTPFTATQSQSLAAGTSVATAVPLPTASAYSGMLQFPAPSSTIPPNTTVTLTSTNVQPSGLPALALARRLPDALRTTDAAGVVALLYVTISYTQTVTYPTSPSFEITVPPSQVLPNTSYYLALFDGLRPSLGWQLGFAGPGVVNGSTIAFNGAPPAFTFGATLPDTFAVYAVSASAPSPTPAPSISPITPPTASPTPTPTPTPTATPTAAPTPFTVSPSSVTLNGIGATATATIADPTNCSCTFSASTANASVATATVSGLTATITAAGVGQTTITITSSDKRTATVGVGVTQTNVSVQGER
jgi:hypothetical protein